MPTAIKNVAQFRATADEQKLVNQIVTRAIPLAKKLGVRYSRLQAEMDLVACHSNGCKLDLAKLLSAGDGDFGHDVFGIRRHIDRTTGKLGGCFLPRCAAPR